MKKLISILILTGCCFAQQSQNNALQLTELEQVKLAKYKAQDDTLNSNIQTLEAQMQILAAKKYILQQAEQQKKSELLGLAEQIKREHDWNTSIIYDPNTGESGTFVKKETKEKEQPKK